MNERRISVIIPFYNAKEYIVDAIESIISQKFPFKKINLFLIDDGSTDGGRYYAELYMKKYENIKYIKQKNRGVSSARNKGIELALEMESEFIFFLDADDKYKENHIQTCMDVLEEHPDSAFVSGMIRFFEGENKLDKEYSLPIYKSTREIKSLNNYEDLAQIEEYKNSKSEGKNTDEFYVGHVGQGGWRATMLKDYRFDESLSYSEDIDFICRILLENNFVFSSDIEYMYRIRFSKDSVINNGKNNLEWYSRVWEIYQRLYEKSISKYDCVPSYIQKTIFKNVLSFFENRPNKEIINQIDKNKFNQAIQFIIENTDKSILENKNIDYWQKMYFYTIKYGKPNLTRWAPIPTFVMNHKGATDEGKRFGYLGTEPLVIHILNERRGILTIRASLRCITYEPFKLDIKSEFAAEIMEVPVPFESDKLFFAHVEIFPRKYYEITIDLHKSSQDFIDDGLIRFFLTTTYDTTVPVPLRTLPFSNMGFSMPFTLGSEYIIKRTAQNNILAIALLSEKELLTTCSNIEPYSGIGKPTAGSVTKFNALKNNVLNLFRTFANKRIWIFMDRGNEIGNNAEVLFRHCVKKDDGIQKYYIIPDKSYSERFLGLPYIVFGTLEYKLLCCFAEKFISSFLFDEGLTLQFGVNKDKKELYEDIRNFKRITKAFFRGDIIHIQHGVIIQDISFYLNKFNEDTKLVCNISKKEYKYVENNMGHAINKDILRLTGLPIYDFLEDVKKHPNSQKIILFAPSFDRNFTSKGKYRTDYKFSEHFQYIQSIIGSKELLDEIEAYGYTLWFKPHYVLVEQLADFSIDSRVKIVTDEVEKYDLYKMCDLMITDYSGIAFEFAYLKKPVIYTHFLQNAKFHETYFSYERDGFGEVCQDFKQFTEVLIGNLKRHCKMSFQYRYRVDAFHTFQDGNNCERVYSEIIKLPDTRKNIFM